MELPKLINQAELARLMWPDNKSAPQKLADKLANRQGKKMTDQDWILAEYTIKENCHINVI